MSISASYLRGFFSKASQTVVREAIQRFGPQYTPGTRPWSAYTVAATINFGLYAVVKPATAGKDYDLSLIQDLFDQAPYWILNRDDWDDSTYGQVDVVVLDEELDGGFVRSATLQLTAYSKLGQWDHAQVFHSHAYPVEAQQNTIGYESITNISQ